MPVKIRHREPMNQRNRNKKNLIPLIILGLFIPFLPAYTICSLPPECTSDGDCVKKFGNDFLCFEHKCQTKSQIFGEKFGESEREPAESTLESNREEKGGNDAGTEQFDGRENLPEPEKAPEPEPIAKRKLFEPCNPSPLAKPEEQCESGLICYQYNNQRSFCVQDCSKNPSICISNKDGRNNCALISWKNEFNPKPIYACVKFAKRGERCEPGINIICMLGQNPHLVCQRGRCVEGILCQKEGCKCGIDLTPPVECDIEKQLLCHPSKKVCVRGIISFESQPCGLYGPPSKSLDRICTAGYSCVKFKNPNSNTPSICLKKCDPKRPTNSCRHVSPSLFCSKDYGLNEPVCIQIGCKNSLCNFNYPHTCYVSTDKNPPDEYCAPLPVPGPVPYGGRCSLKNSQLFCQHPFFCLPLNQNTGFCSIQCTDSQICQQFDKDSRCILINRKTGVRYCGWDCSRNVCPPKMVCFNNRFCIPK